MFPRNFARLRLQRQTLLRTKSQRTALKNNYDVRIAATRVLEAQAQLGITRADQLPSVSAGGNIQSERTARNGVIPSFQTTLGQVTASASWNLDFWGRYRRATEAARANLLASEWGQKAVISSLVANVAARTSLFANWTCNWRLPGARLRPARTPCS